jgi:spoIIIJ-associated protein
MDYTQLKDKVQTYLNNLISPLGIEYSLEIEEIESENKIYININSQNDSLLVGYHANNLNSIQHILNLFLHKDMDSSSIESHPIVIIDVGGYRKGREHKLKEMAKEVADKAKELGKSISLYPMSSYERRIVHEAIAAIDGVTSYSEGEGSERKIIVSLKKDEI